MRDPDPAADPTDAEPSFAAATVADATAADWAPVLADAAPAVLTVDLDAIVANWRSLRARAAPAACAAVVKADAYGLGAARVAPALTRAGCRDFFVAHAAEGAALRPLLPPDARVFVLNGALPGSEAALAAARLIPVLGSLDEIDRWRGLGARMDGAPPAALHVDTGMARLGLPPDELAALAADPARLDGVALALVISHFACADEPDHPANARQIARFREARAVLPPAPGALANSSGIFLGPDAHADLVRPGAALYGINPTPGRPNPMSPVIRLEATVLQTRTVPRGESVGYGHAWTAPGPTRLATIAAGYADGWPRAAGAQGAAWFGDARLPFAGRVSMDLATLDASAAPGLAPGRRVELIGPHQDVDAVAEAAGTIGYEILTRLGRRYARRYVGDA